MRISDWSSDVCSSDLPSSDRNSDTEANRRTWELRSTATPCRPCADRPADRRGIYRASPPSVAVRCGLSAEPRCGDDSIPLRCSGYRRRRLRIGWRNVDGLRALSRRRKPALDFGAENLTGRSEEHTSELQSLMRISYAVF